MERTLLQSVENIDARRQASKRHPRIAAEDLAVGAKVWLQLTSGDWLRARVTKITTSPAPAALIEDLGTQARRTLSITDICAVLPCPADELEVGEDLTKLSPLHEHAVLFALQGRHALRKCYTSAGLTLLAVNPFQPLPLFDESHFHAYHTTSKLTELPPHVFAIAERAYRLLRDSPASSIANQCIIVSGESGAGKTFSTRAMLEYLARVSSDGKKGCLTTRILGSNPILEAFGNAKTNMNNNSSRFGKFVRLQFTPHLIMEGANTLVIVMSNFHIFYQLLAGATPQEREQWLLPEGNLGSGFAYIRDRCSSRTHNDASCFAATRAAMSDVSLAGARQHAVLQVVAALLHLGNIEHRATTAEFELQPALLATSRLLDVTSADLADALTNRAITIGSETFKRPMSETEFSSFRDSLARSIYAGLFNWITSYINEQNGPKHVEPRFIGLFDVFGFESGKANDLEQLCINYANERLQHHFVKHVLETEQREHMAEGLAWEKVIFTDNNDCVCLLDSMKLSIFSLLDEECQLNRRSSQEGVGTLLTKLHANFKGNGHYVVPKLSGNVFGIRHYAGDVLYNIDSFVQKNKEKVLREHIEVLMRSGNDFIERDLSEQLVATLSELDGSGPDTPSARCLTPGRRTGSKSKRRLPTVVSNFKKSLNELFDTLRLTTPHYVRCLAPNDEASPSLFNGSKVQAQLRASGVLASVQISAAGLPCRLAYQEFARCYQHLLPLSERVLAPPAMELTRRVLERYCEDAGAIKYGRTKVFMKDWQLGALEHARFRFDQAVLKLQRCWRARAVALCARAAFVRARAACLRLQLWWRLVRACRQKEKADKEERERKQEREREREREREQEAHAHREREQQRIRERDLASQHRNQQHHEPEMDRPAKRQHQAISRRRSEVQPAMAQPMKAARESLWPLHLTPHLVSRHGTEPLWGVYVKPSPLPFARERKVQTHVGLAVLLPASNPYELTE